MLALLVLGLAGYAAASPYSSSIDTLNLFGARAISSGCSTTGTASCHNTTAVSNLCCFEAPGGLLLQTQFWDTAPSTGPSDSWTIHGLWPDNCDLTFDSSCDPSRAYTGISSLLTANGASDTLAFMQKFWVDINGANEQFWEHEWAKHGTCMSTLKTSCLPSGSPRGAEAVAYFQTVVKLFKSLPTYTWLSNAGITPSSSKTYTLSTLTAALKSASGGFTPALDCTSSNLNAISWYFNLKGSAIDGVFAPINAPAAGSCPSSGIKYPLKSGSPTTTASPTTTGPAGSLPTRATIKALQSGSLVGGLLSLGTWSTQTLATYTISGGSSSFTMTSSKGNCGVTSGLLSCGSGVSLTSFSAVTSGSNLLLASGGSTSFTSDGIPSGTTVFPVFSGSNRSQDYTLVIVAS
ncbi:ribonuclease T2 [Collybia nuda]|uniref:Ribonuclease T2-like n=1 Tax=Collybia nuda TaxID=64659 RepID=A0A9P5YLK7_9AGAR|nr:ribonuclease T2 [Collybia nuda]